MSENKKWMSSGFATGKPSGGVDREKGIIRGVSVCTVGEAKGHGVNLDSEFIESVKAFGNEKKQGLKARYGHPNMCSTALGTFIGRYKNFSVVNEQVIADLFLSNEAKSTPNGDLHSYILGMAENEPDMFGTSIVFTPGRSYKRSSKGVKVYRPSYEDSREERDQQREEWNVAGDEIFVECESLHACDCVDEPAANDGGLFSKFANESVAGQITQFLDLNPQVWEALESNPSILESLARYGTKMDEFTNRYRDYREQSMEAEMSDKTKSADADVVEKLDATDNSTEETSEKVETADVVEKTEETETAEETVEGSAEEKPEELSEIKELSKDEFLKIADEFGADVALETVKTGGDYNSALLSAYNAEKSGNVELRTQIEKLSASSNGSPAPVVVKTEKKSLFKLTK